MDEIKLTAKKIVEIALTCDTIEHIQPVKIGEKHFRNEFVLFIKPEVFLHSDSTHSEKGVELILQKIKEFDAHVAGISVIGGSVIDQKEIMNRHYGFINKLSRSASSMVNEADKKKIEESAGAPINDHEILGGHEYLEKYPTESTTDIDKLWFEEKSSKIRSGFYVRHLVKDGKHVHLINGFHPEQLRHYTDPSHKIVLMVIHSNNDWSTLRNEMIGTTFPEKASPNSIRGAFYAHAKQYGFDDVTIANNCVHLSAGPFESLFEIINFYGGIIGMNLETHQPLTWIRMLEAGIQEDDAFKSINNPSLKIEDKSTDLFSATEDKNTDDAVNLYKNSLN